MSVTIRPATAADFEAIWKILEPIFRAGEAFAEPRDISREDSIAYWCAPSHSVFVAEQDGEIVGTYWIRANQPGPGSHVANAGYATAAAASGRGVARAMCAHSLETARQQGYRAMQFNIVVSTNERAVRLWLSMGFETVGRLPGAFLHPTLGYVDALVMFRTLTDV